MPCGLPMSKSLASEEPNNQTSEDSKSELKPRKSIKTKLLRWALILMTSSLFILIGLYLYLNNYLKYQLTEFVSLTTDKKYELSIGDLHFDFLSSSVQIRDVRLLKIADSLQSDVWKVEGVAFTKVELGVDQLNIESFDWWHYLKERQLSIGELFIYNPQFKFFRRANQQSPTRLNLDSLNYHVGELVCQFTERLYIQDIRVASADIDVHLINAQEKEIFQTGENMNIEVKGFQVASTSQTAYPIGLQVQDIALEFHNYGFDAPDGSYEFTMGSLFASLSDSSIRVDKLHVQPFVNDSSDKKKLPTEVDLYAHEIALQGIDFHTLLHDRDFVIRAFSIKDSKINVQKNTLEKAKKTEEAQAQAGPSAPKLLSPSGLSLDSLFARMPVSVEIKQFQFDNAQLAYQLAPTLYRDSAYVVHQADSIYLQIDQVALGKAWQKTENPRQECLQNLDLKFRNYSHQSVTGIYNLFLRRAHLSEKESFILMEEARVIPQINPRPYAASLPFQKIILNAEAAQLSARNISWQRLVYNQEFVLGELRVVDPSMDAYMDRTKPKQPGQRFKNLEEVIKSIPVFIDIDTLLLVDGSLAYSEKNKLGKDDGIAQHEARSIDLHISPIRLGKAFINSPLAEADKRDLRVNIQDYQFQTADGAFALSFDQLNINSLESFIYIDTLRIKPLISEQAFAQSNMPWPGLIDVQVDQIRAEEISFLRLFLFQEIDFTKLQFIQPNIYLYRDRRKRYRSPLDSLNWGDYSQRGDLRLSLRKRKRLRRFMPQNTPDLFRSSVLSPPSPQDSSWLGYSLPLRGSRYDTILPVPIPGLRHPTQNEKLAFTSQTMSRRQALIKSRKGLRKILSDLPIFLKVDTFLVENAQFIYKDQHVSEEASGMAYHFADSITFIIPQIYLGKATQDSSFQYFYSGNILLNLKNYQFKDKEDQFMIAAREVESSLEDSLLIIHDLGFKPIQSREVFTHERPFRSMHLHADLKQLVANAIDLDRLVFDQEFALNSLSLSRPSIRMYTDLEKPTRPKPEPLNFKKLLAQVPFLIKIDSFKLREGKLELEALAERKDSLKFLARHYVQDIQLDCQQIHLYPEKYRFQLIGKELFNIEEGRLLVRDYSFIPPKQPYRFSWDTLAFDIKPAHFFLKNVRWSPQISRQSFDSIQQYRNPQLDIRAQKITGRWGDLDRFMRGEGYDLQYLGIQGAHVDLYQNNLLPKNSNPSGQTPEQIIESIPFFLKLDTLDLQNLALQYDIKREYKGRTIQNRHRAERIDLWMNRFQCGPENPQNLEQLLGAHSIKLDVQDYATLSSDSLYAIGIRSIRANTDDSLFKVRSFQVTPTLHDEEFMQRKDFQTDRMSIRIRDMESRSLDFRRLVNYQEFFAEHLALDTVKIDIYRDKRLAKNPRLAPRMPNEAFQRIPFPMQIDTVQLMQTQAVYKEKVPQGVGTGKVFFSEIQGNIIKLSNLSTPGDTTLVQAQGRLMNQGLLQVNMKIPLMSPQLYARYEGTLGKMQAGFFNSMIESNEHVRIRRGQINRVSYAVTLNDSLASGSLYAGYRRLRIQVLKKEDHAKKRGFITFLANLILNNRNNIERRKSKGGEVFYEPQEEDGFVKILWKSLSTGLVDTLK